MHNLLSNLFRNAVEHNRDSVEITVGVLDDGFYVADDGIGLNGQRTDVFRMGYSSAEDGTGMGLAIVAQFAEAHGWSVDVSTDETTGARFDITGLGVSN